MQTKHIAMATVVAVALLAPLARWGLEARQDAADRKTSIDVERRFAARTASTDAVQAPTDRPNSRGRWNRSGQADGTETGRSQRMQHLATELGLSAEQTSRFEAIQQSARPVMRDIMRNPQLTREQKRAQIEPIRAAQQEQINRLLTPAQQAKYATFQEKMRQQRLAWRQRNTGTNGEATGSETNERNGTR